MTVIMMAGSSPACLTKEECLISFLSFHLQAGAGRESGAANSRRRGRLDKNEQRRYPQVAPIIIK